MIIWNLKSLFSSKKPYKVISCDKQTSKNTDIYTRVSIYRDLIYRDQILSPEIRIYAYGRG